MIFDIANNVPADQEALIRTGLDLAQSYVGRAFGLDIADDVKATIVVKIVNTGLGNQEVGGGGASATAFSEGKIRPFFDVGHVQWNQDSTWRGWTTESDSMKTVAHEYAHGWQGWLGAISNYSQPLGNALNEGIAEFVAYSVMVDAGRMSWDNIKPFMLTSAFYSDELAASVRDVENVVWSGHVGFLAIDWLVGDAPSGLLSLRTLAQEIARGETIPNAFRTAFNVELESFYTQFEAWRQIILADLDNGYANRPALINIGENTDGTITIAENTIVVTAVVSAEVDSGVLTHEIIGGADQSKFQINATSGILSFIAAPDFEAPTDVGSDNIYDVIVRVSDGSLIDDQTIAVTITDTAGNSIAGSPLPDTIDGTTPNDNPATNEEDRIDAGAGDDTIFALGGNDTVRGGLGKDSMDGGAGRDTLDYAEKTKAITLTLNGAVPTVVKVGANEDTVANFESVIGGTGADKINGDGFDNFLSGEKGADALTGNGGLDTLIGGLGNDKLNGGAGADNLEGGLGADALTGGTEADRFLFNVAVTTANADKISDMEHDIDLILLDDAFFAAIGATLDANQFVSGPKVTKAIDADDRILYDTKTGALSYDLDGNGAGKAVKFATLTNKPQFLDHGDFLIV